MHTSMRTASGVHTPSVHSRRGYTLQVCTAGGDTYSNALRIRGTHSKRAQKQGIHTPSVHSRGCTLQVCTEAGDAHSKCAQKLGMRTPSVLSRRGYTLQVCTAGRVVHSKCAQQDGRHRALEGLFAHIAPSCPSLQAGHEPQGNGRTKGKLLTCLWRSDRWGTRGRNQSASFLVQRG